MTGEHKLKEMIIEIGRRLWVKGYVAANDGNITVRIGDNTLLTTPTGVSKGFMTQDMILKVNMDGKPVSKNSRYKPSSEVKMHLEVYKKREDITSVIHAHPPYCTSFSVAGIPLDKCVLPEAILTLGAVPIAPYGTPSTSELADSIKSLVVKSDALLLANHGALSLGMDLVTAYHRMETLEHAATIVYHAIQLGNVNIISNEEVRKLLKIRKTMKIPGRINVTDRGLTSDSNGIHQSIIEEIARSVIERLKKK